MREVHDIAVREGGNHLILCSHPPVFTVGPNEKREWGVPAVRTDRGGSITCHGPGQLVAYFCFQAPRPALFYRKVVRAYDALFATLLPAARYDAKRPGWYLDGTRKVASLGFRYEKGVSRHGVALNVDVDLDFCNRVAPCALKGVRASSLRAEGVKASMERVETVLLAALCEAFGETLEEVP